MIKSSSIFVKLPDITGLYVVEQVQEHQSQVLPGLMLQANSGLHARIFKKCDDCNTAGPARKVCLYKSQPWKRQGYFESQFLTFVQYAGQYQAIVSSGFGSSCIPPEAHWTIPPRRLITLLMPCLLRKRQACADRLPVRQ